TAAGTMLVKDINTAGSSSPQHFVNVAGTLYFQANNGTNGAELWRSDGTAAGTFMVKDIAGIAAGRASSSPNLLTKVAGTLCFVASSGPSGNEIWQSDGTATGTVLVADLRLVGGSNPTSLTNVAGALYFAANDGFHGQELWAFNPATAGDYDGNGAVDG